jgi:nucleotide-binding universal stress UspA family protein
MLPIKTVLHPTDFSERSNYAFRLASSLAADYGARLVVLHVYQPPIVVGGEGVAFLPCEQDREALLRQLHEMRPRDARVAVECRVVEGEAVAEILRAAEETKCEVVVMGTHGRTGLGRLVLGSVAEQVLRKAPCAVTTVKGPAREVVSAEVPDSEPAVAHTAGTT